MYVVIGVILLCIGIISNELVLAKLFAQDGMLEEITRIKILSFDIFLIFSGLFFILFRNKISRYKQLLFRYLISCQRTVAILVGFIFSITIILFIEFGFYFLNILNESRKEKNIYTERPISLKEDDKILGYKPRRSVQVSAMKKVEGRVVYDVVYSTDKYSRRITPMNDTQNRKNFILFFGGSFAFGEGVNDDETMPFYASYFARQYKSYNYGVPGYGPQGMLAILQDRDITKEIPEKNGLLIYLFIDHHINRAIGDMYVYNAWGKRMPYYIIDSNNTIQRQGNFKSNRLITSSIYALFGKSQIVKYFHVNLPNNINDNHIILSSKIIEESRNIFRNKFHSDEFYVLFYPGKKIHKRMIPYLERARIRYLDYSNLANLKESEFSIKGDGHPTPKANLIIAKKLLDDIGILDDSIQSCP
jgi:uncharacterized membrane protein YobD (UPF0266 family)